MWYNVSGAKAKKIAKEMERDKADTDDSEDVDPEPSTVDIPRTPDNSGAKALLVYSSEMHKIAMKKEEETSRESNTCKKAMWCSSS